MKLYRLSVTRAMSGHPLRGQGIRVDRLGYPLFLSPTLRKELHKGCPKAIRATLTALTLSRLELGGTPIDFTSIVEPSSADRQTIDLILDFAKTKLNIEPHSVPNCTVTADDYERGLTVDEWLAGPSFHWTLKTGPNGPALATALTDLKALPTTLVESLKVLDPRLAPVFEVLQNNGALVDWYQSVVDAGSKRVRTGAKALIRKLSVKDDKETKSRVFAILDYWSQLGLKEFHHHLFKELKRFPQDCSFDQLSGTRLRNSPGPFISADLSAATDRFPMDLQVGITEMLTNNSFASA